MLTLLKFVLFVVFVNVSFLQRKKISKGATVMSPSEAGTVCAQTLHSCLHVGLFNR